MAFLSLSMFPHTAWSHLPSTFSVMSLLSVVVWTGRTGCESRRRKLSATAGSRLWLRPSIAPSLQNELGNWGLGRAGFCGLAKKCPSMWRGNWGEKSCETSTPFTFTALHDPGRGVESRQSCAFPPLPSTILFKLTGLHFPMEVFFQFSDRLDR